MFRFLVLCMKVFCDVVLLMWWCGFRFSCIEFMLCVVVSVDIWFIGIYSESVFWWY